MWTLQFHDFSQGFCGVMSDVVSVSRRQLFELVAKGAAGAVILPACGSPAPPPIDAPDIATCPRTPGETAGYATSQTTFQGLTIAGDNVFGDDDAVHELTDVTGSVTEGFVARLTVAVLG